MLAAAETALLAPLLDGVVLVAAHDETSKTLLRSAQQAFDQVGARNLWYRI